MSSGQKTVVIGTSERAVSTDANRAQTFLAYGQAEVLRQLLNVGAGATDDLDAGVDAFTAYAQPALMATPRKRGIINGAAGVQPLPGVLGLAVSPGTLCALQVDATAPEDSAYKIVQDPGIDVTAGLAMTANSSGSPRVDVIECQVGYEVIETDNRDVFNPVTGQFAGTSLAKVTRGRVTLPVGTNIRVRQGTPGSGFPGTVQGWLPLAVALVPDGSTTNNNIVFWDVRPLVNDRVNGVGACSQNRPVPLLPGSEINALAPATTGGVIYANLNGRRIGGRLRSGNDGASSTLSADVETIDLTSALNAETGFSTVANQLWHLYFCCPFKLPRWARYTTGPIGRRPRSPRGIPLMSTVAPDRYGRPSSAINLPASWAAGAVQITEAVHVATGYANPSNTISGFVLGGDRARYADDFFTTTYPRRIAGSDSAGAGFAASAITLTPGTHFPADAKEILVSYFAVIETSSDSGAPSFIMGVMPPGVAPAGFGFAHVIYLQSPSLKATQSTRLEFEAWVPVASSYPANTQATIGLQVALSSGSGTFSFDAASVMQVQGYKL